MLLPTMKKQRKSKETGFTTSWGRLIFNEESFEQAILLLSKSLEINPEYATYVSRGGYYFRGEYDKSWRILKSKDLGYTIPVEFLRSSRRASGRISKDIVVERVIIEFLPQRQHCKQSSIVLRCPVCMNPF